MDECAGPSCACAPQFDTAQLVLCSNCLQVLTVCANCAYHTLQHVSPPGTMVYSLRLCCDRLYVLASLSNQAWLRYSRMKRTAYACCSDSGSPAMLLAEWLRKADRDCCTNTRRNASTCTCTDTVVALGTGHESHVSRIDMVSTQTQLQIQPAAAMPAYSCFTLLHHGSAMVAACPAWHACTYPTWGMTALPCVGLSCNRCLHLLLWCHICRASAAWPVPTAAVHLATAHSTGETPPLETCQQPAGHASEHRSISEGTVLGMHQLFRMLDKR